jgi:hypothetical protein
MSDCTMRMRGGAGHAGTALLAVITAVSSAPPAGAARPIDAPSSNEPRVAVAKCLSQPGLVASRGTGQPFARVSKGEELFSRDLLVALPGFKVEAESASGGVKLTLWGNLPQLSDSPALESAVILHDSKAYDLDLTLVRGRVVLTNTRSKGAAKVWLRAEGGVQMILPEPGDTVALETFGRWPSGVPFKANRPAGQGPIRLWEVYCLKGKLEIKADRTEWFMSEPPGPAYFHGDSAEGPSRSGPEKRAAVPEWYDAKATSPKMAKLIDDVVKTYSGRLETKDPDEIAAELLALADKDTNKDRARVLRYLIVHAYAAMDEVEKVAEILGTSKHDEERKAAVVALRHWIGAREGRDEKLYEILQRNLGYSRSEAETVMQLLHSPFDPRQPETFETLIAYLKHRKQAVRELAHWHLVRLAPIGRDIPYDAAGSPAERDKAAAEWKMRIPSGELPKEKTDGTKAKP